MHRGTDNFFHLTYCTNIHPGNGWSEVYGNLQRYASPLKARLAPSGAFGIGLRLSGRESSELLQDDSLQQFQAFLQEHGLYVFTLNGFPYGPFHQQPVKAQVHAPDWRDEERVRYTLRLIEILAFLLPDQLDGSISTSPLSYKAWVDRRDSTTWAHLTHNIVRVQTKDGIDKWGEVTVPEGADVLLLRTVKADGSTREPEEVAEKRPADHQPAGADGLHAPARTYSGLLRYVSCGGRL